MKVFTKYIHPVCGLFILLFILSCKNEKPVTKTPSADTVTTPPPVVKRLFYDSLPQPTGFVNDYEHIFSANEKNTLESIAATFQKETGVQIVIATFDSMMTTADNLSALTLKLSNYWGVGQKGKDNGIVIGLSKHYRNMRIENGKGIAKMLSDNESKQIIDEDFIPSFKQGNYYEGMKRGLLSLMQKLRLKFTAYRLPTFQKLATLIATS